MLFVLHSATEACVISLSLVGRMATAAIIKKSLHNKQAVLKKLPYIYYGRLLAVSLNILISAKNNLVHIDIPVRAVVVKHP